MNIDPDRLRWFVAVADQPHFGRAATSLNVSRQALSTAMNALATELQTELFVPGARPTELTEAGWDLLERARPIIADDDRRAARAKAEQPMAQQILRVGFVPGVTVTKWSRIWAQRFRQVRLEVVGIAEQDVESALREDRVDMCFVRLPVDRDDLFVIPLYREVAVVVVPKDHPVSLFDEVTLADLVDESRLNDVDPADAVDLVAGGAGILVVPQSIARSHSRSDVVHRPVTDAPETQIALAWRIDVTTDLTEEFVGVVRGRSAHSSRSPSRSGPQRGDAPDRAGQGAAKRQDGKGSGGKGQNLPANRSKRGAPVGGKRPAKRRGR